MSIDVIDGWVRKNTWWPWQKGLPPADELGVPFYEFQTELEERPDVRYTTVSHVLTREEADEPNSCALFTPELVASQVWRHVHINCFLRNQEADAEPAGQL